MQNFRLLFIFLILATNILQASEDIATNAVEKVEHFWIPLKDGTKLAAKMWLPKDAEQHPVPGILEYIPYGKRYGTRGRDETMHHWFASHGYAALRVDLRGSGESDGLLTDEYLKLEQDDALEVIAWIAQQKWCTGSVGMMGKSWGGFNALQVAARQPEALKAIITVCSTDDRYADDIHYMGGCLLNDNLWWGAIMLAYQSQPEDQRLTDANGHQQWLNRLENMPFWPALWLKYQRRNDYWKQGSVCENYDAIKCPVLAIGGWVDAYTNAVPRLLENLKVPRLGIIGPWAHVYPHDGTPGPAIGYLQESCRWWDQWLKGKETKIMEEPMLRVYIEEWSAPTGTSEQAIGRWVAEKEWPSAQIQSRKLYLTSSGLTPIAKISEDKELSIHSPLWVGAAVGEWMGTGVPGELPTDQQIDDDNSLVFDSSPLEGYIELLGAPKLTLQIASDKPIAQICARLCDVAADGTSKRISYQILNLTHRDSHETPEILVPGKFYEVHIKLNDCGYAYDKGHRIRLALSTAYWPLVWPTPESATLTIKTQGSMLELPTRTPQAEDAQVVFEKPAYGPFIPITQLDKGCMIRTHHVDELKQKATYITDAKGGVFGEGIIQFDDIDISLSHNLKRELTISKDDPLSANYVLTQTYTVKHPNRIVRIESLIKMHSTLTDFILTGNLKVFENDKECAQKVFAETIERDHL